MVWAPSRTTASHPGEPGPWVYLSLSLNPCRFTALDLSLPCCFSAELGEPRTHLLSMKTRFLSCCSFPCGKAAATHLAHPPLDIQCAGTAPSLQSTEMPRLQSAWERCGNGTKQGSNSLFAASHFGAWGCVGQGVWAYFAPRNRYTDEKARSCPLLLALLGIRWRHTGTLKPSN